MKNSAAVAEQLRLAERALQGGRFAEATELLLAAARKDRDSPRPSLMLAYALAQLGQADDAIRVLQRLITRYPFNGDAWQNLGNLLRKQRRFEEALSALRRAAALRPGSADAPINIGYVLMQQGRSAEAEGEILASLARFPLEPDLLVNLAQARRRMRRWDEALATLDRCLELVPGHVGYAVTRALVRFESGDDERALAELDGLLGQVPGDGDVHFLRAQVLLSRRDWRRGWNDYLWRPDRLRWLLRERKPADTPAATVASLQGREVCLEGEQGLGDTLFFLRFAAGLLPLVRGVHLDIDSRLAAAMHLDWVSSGEPSEEPVRVLVGDLPAILGAGPVASVRLRADASRRAQMGERLAACGPPPYLGLSWEGGVPWEEQSAPGAGLFKRVPPSELGAAIEPVPCTLVSLQRRAHAGDREALASAAHRPVHDFAFVNDDLADALALLACLDDYVAVSNTNVHLNDAIGKRTRVLLTRPAEWRWALEEDRPVWFPNALTYRQDREGSWHDALGRLRADLCRGITGVSASKPIN